MNKDIDLTKILEGCPYGTEFYHSCYGKVWFIGIDIDLEYPIHIKLDSRFYEDARITSAGTLNKNYNGECVLFPSKDQRDWSKFERFWDKPKVEKFDVNTLQPFDKVLVRLSSAYPWECDFFSYIRDASNPDFVKGRPIATVNNVYSIVIPYNEETKHLVGTYNDCPDYYKWWEK